MERRCTVPPSGCLAATDALGKNTQCESFTVNATVTDIRAVCNENCKNLINGVIENCPNMVCIHIPTYVAGSSKYI